MKIPKLPFELPDLRDVLSRMFRFSRKEVIIIAASLSVLLVAALIITIVALSASGRTTITTRADKIQTVSTEATGNITNRAFLSDFIIYDDSLEESFTGIIYSRQPVKKWSDKMVDEYWIDPREIAADQLEKDAEKMIRDIFADVP